MILCFGIFAKILNLCNRGLAQEKFVPRIAWVVDRRNSSLASRLDFIVHDPDGMEGNKSVVARLLSCERPLVLKEKELPTSEVACERFKAKVMPFIDDLKVANAVLATLYIISADKTIEDERKERFREYLGMYRDELLQQTTFNVPDFFARVLLYTTCVDNNEGHPYTEQVAGSFIEKVVKESWVETKWDATTQAIEIIPSEERRLFDEVNVLSELRFSLMTNQVSCADTGWLGVDESVLFPSRKSIDFGNPTTKAMLWSKLDQYTKLVHELTDCLMAQQRSTAGRTTMWPIFPDERMQDIRQRLMNLSNEILFLGLFPERLNEG